METPNDTIHASSQATQLQRSRISNASKAFSRMSPRDQADYYTRLEFTPTGKLATGLNLYVSQHVIQQITHEDKDKAPFQAPAVIYTACVAIIFPDGTLTSIIQPGFWNTDLNMGNGGFHMISLGHFVVSDWSRMGIPCRVWGISGPYNLMPTQPLYSDLQVLSIRYLYVGLAMTGYVYPHGGFIGGAWIDSNPRLSNQSIVNGMWWGSGVAGTNKYPWFFGLRPHCDASGYVSAQVLHGHPPGTDFAMGWGWTIPPYNFRCYCDDLGVHNIQHCDDNLFPLL
jgi:hypothetical protein